MDDLDLVELVRIQREPSGAALTRAREMAWSMLESEMAGVPADTTTPLVPLSVARRGVALRIAATLAAVAAVVVLVLVVADAPEGPNSKVEVGPAGATSTTPERPQQPEQPPTTSEPSGPPVGAVYALPRTMVPGFAPRSWHDTTGSGRPVPEPQLVQVFGRPSPDGASLKRWVAVMVMTSGTIGDAPGSTVATRTRLLGYDVAVVTKANDPFVNAVANVTTPEGRQLAVRATGRGSTPEEVASFAASLSFDAGSPLLVRAPSPLGLEPVFSGPWPITGDPATTITYSNDPRLRGGALTDAGRSGMATIAITAQPAHGAPLVGLAWMEADVAGFKVGDRPALQYTMSEFGRTTVTVKVVVDDVLVSVRGVNVSDTDVRRVVASLEVVGADRFKAQTQGLLLEDEGDGPGLSPAYEPAGEPAVVARGDFDDGRSYRWELFEALPPPFSVQQICERFLVDEQPNSASCGEAYLPPATGANLRDAHIPPSGDDVLLIRAGDAIRTIEVTFDDGTTTSVPTSLAFDWYPTRYAALALTDKTPATVIGIDDGGVPTAPMAVRGSRR